MHTTLTHWRIWLSSQEMRDRKVVGGGCWSEKRLFLGYILKSEGIKNREIESLKGESFLLFGYSFYL